MIDDGLGFQLVPWRPALEQQLCRHISGVVLPGGGINWSFGRKRGLELDTCDEVDKNDQILPAAIILAQG